MRLLFVLVLLVGAAIGVFYPFVIQNFSGREIGEWPAYERATGYRPVLARLVASQAPVRVLVDLKSIGMIDVPNKQTLLTITAANAGRTVLATTLTFAATPPRPDSPQSGGQTYRADAGLISSIEDGTYTFTVGPGDAEGIQMQSVALILRQDAAAYDSRVQPVGFTLMAIGFIGLVLAIRGGSTPSNPNSQPPPPPAKRWGRAGGEGR